jgi:tRNA(His) 5'-end guanylyltransferase
MKDSLGDRMKNNYEKRARTFLTRRTPVIMRLDGKAFHTLTRSCDKPFDSNFSYSMNTTAMELVREIQGAKVAYIQSDEISILITDFDRLTTDAWFDYNVQKMTSISAGIASVTFSESFGKIGLFDSRVFNIPKEEVANYFVWRQNDWVRNSLSMLAQAHFSHRQLHKQSQADMHEMLHTKGINWAKLIPRLKNGTFITKNLTTFFNVIVKENREFIEQFLKGDE